ncbi:MAG: hypothetical protein K2Y05_01835 [Hyphomicrobiaceae bacterium]|nr:hypothetical protein [Hyphomicrobiaceae bacterium]
MKTSAPRPSLSSVLSVRPSLAISAHRVTAFVAMAVAAAILAGTIKTAAAADAGTHVFKPGRGISLDVGATKIAGYYIQTGGNCGVTLMMGQRADADGNVAGGVVRTELPVRAGGSARVSTPDGRVVELGCGTGGRLLTVTPASVVASLVK